MSETGKRLFDFIYILTGSMFIAIGTHSVWIGMGAFALAIGVWPWISDRRPSC